MHYYKHGIKDDAVVLNTDINQRDVIMLGEITGIKIGGRIFYRDNSRFWYKDVNTDTDHLFDVINNLVTDEAVGFFDDYIAVEDKAFNNPELLVCKLYDYYGNELDSDSSAQVSEQVKIILTNLLVDRERYNDYYNKLEVGFFDRPHYKELFGHCYGTCPVDRDLVSGLTGEIKAKGMLNRKACDMLHDYMDMLTEFCGGDVGMPLVNMLALFEIPLDEYMLLFVDKNPLHDKQGFDSVRSMLGDCPRDLAVKALNDYGMLKDMYDSYQGRKEQNL